MFDILSWIVFGLIAGIVAKLLTPGRDPGGFIITIFLGIAGSLLGGWVARLLGITGGWLTGFVMAVIGAVILLVIYRLIKGRTSATV
jgi:uncharacterized membrane protein YeaQ/YmgE (transglycosylase-associated protein family)